MSQWKGPVVSDSTSKGVCRSFNRRPSDCTVKAACLRNHGYRGRKSLSCSWKRARSTKAAKGKVNHKEKRGGASQRAAAAAAAPSKRVASGLPLSFVWLASVCWSAAGDSIIFYVDRCFFLSDRVRETTLPPRHLDRNSPRKRW